MRTREDGVLDGELVATGTDVWEVIRVPGGTDVACGRVTGAIDNIVAADEARRLARDVSAWTEGEGAWGSMVALEVKKRTAAAKRGGMTRCPHDIAPCYFKSSFNCSVDVASVRSRS